MWTVREFSVAEAAAISGIHRANIDLIIHRARDCEVLFSEKRNHRRWFSPRDIAVLRIAYECERAGQIWMTALARAYEHLQVPPSPDAILVFPSMSVAHTSGRIITAAEPVDKSMVLVPIGKIVGEVVARTTQLKEAADVAI